MRRDRRGFTLVELLVVLALAALIAALAVPLFGRYSATLKGQAAAGHLAADLQLARTWAARRGTQVAVRLAPTGYTIVELGSGGSQAIVKAVDWAREFPGVALEPPPGVAEVRFDSRGLVVPTAAGTGVLVFTVRHAAGTEEVTLTPLGRVSRGP